MVFFHMECTQFKVTYTRTDFVLIEKIVCFSPRPVCEYIRNILCFPSYETMGSNALLRLLFCEFVPWLGREIYFENKFGNSHQLTRTYEEYFSHSSMILDASQVADAEEISKF